MKKILNLGLVVLLLLLQIMPVNALIGTNNNGGSITINNVVGGKTYKIYQMLILESYDTEKEAYTYKVDVNGEELKKAENYNNKLRELENPLYSFNSIQGYNDILNIGNTGMIGHITIDKIKVKLPIYHGTSEKVLNKAVGHVEGTSLPIGGIGTHSVLSAHRGLPSSMLFTDLDKLEIGDIFFINVLDKELTYEVDQILIVEPSEINKIKIDNNEDYVTLITCTPYGINTERLLVRGKRTENIEKTIYITTEAFKISNLIVMLLIAIPIILILLIILLLKPIKKEKYMQEVTNDKE